MDKLDNNKYDNTNITNTTNTYDHTNMTNTNTYNNINNDIRNEKKVILYLIIIIFVLIYIALFFINYIVDRGYLKETITGNVIIPNNTISNETNTVSNNTNTTNNNTTQGQSGTHPSEHDTPVINNEDRLKIKEGNTEFEELKELRLFENDYFKYTKKIAPGVSGVYNFTVENDTQYDFIYDLVFNEENLFNINMVYKIKVNGNYIVGSEDTWETHRNFENKNMEISAYSIDVYTIEWKWQDADNDTEIGMTDGAYYKMNICMQASQIIK